MGAAKAAKGGFSLVEVLVACALLALALVPLLRAAHANNSVALWARDKARQAIERGDAAARERVDAAVERNASNPR